MEPEGHSAVPKPSNGKRSPLMIFALVVVSSILASQMQQLRMWILSDYMPMRLDEMRQKGRNGAPPRTAP
jgi:hypothetical protein